MSRRASPAVLLATILAGGCFARQYRQNPRVAVVDGDPVVQMKPASRFPHLSGPRMVAKERQSDPPTALERVLGISFGTAPRAYPVGLLERYEVVNDEVEALPYVVARCGLTGVVAVYDRRVEGRALEFENSGALWRDTLVLRDRQTGTYWAAATGVGLAGALAGRRLDRVPAVIALEADWARAHRDSLYFDAGRSTSVPLTMRIYGRSAMQGVSGTKTDDARYPPKQEVWTLSAGDEAIAFTAAEIEDARSIPVRLGTLEARIEWDSALAAPRAFSEGSAVRELALVPMYWFAVPRQFRSVQTLPPNESPPQLRGDAGAARVTSSPPR